MILVDDPEILRIWDNYQTYTEAMTINREIGVDMEDTTERICTRKELGKLAWAALIEKYPQMESDVQKGLSWKIRQVMSGRLMLFAPGEKAVP